MNEGLELFIGIVIFGLMIIIFSYNFINDIEKEVIVKDRIIFKSGCEILTTSGETYYLKSYSHCILARPDNHIKLKIQKFGETIIVNNVTVME